MIEEIVIIIALEIPIIVGIMIMEMGVCFHKGSAIGYARVIICIAAISILCHPILYSAPHWGFPMPFYFAMGDAIFNSEWSSYDFKVNTNLIALTAFYVPILVYYGILLSIKWWLLGNTKQDNNRDEEKRNA